MRLQTGAQYDDTGKLRVQKMPDTPASDGPGFWSTAKVNVPATLNPALQRTPLLQKLLKDYVMRKLKPLDVAKHNITIVHTEHSSITAARHARCS